MSDSSPSGDLATALERGEIIHYPVAPFPLPVGDDLRFLLAQRLASRAHKNISYDPRSRRIAGHRPNGAAAADQLRLVLAGFSDAASRWLASVLPEYAAAWQLERVSFRPEEEKTRRLRWKQRNDLLHVDAFPGRPAGGHRILRLFANVNPIEPRVWVTSEPFRRLFEAYGSAAGLASRPAALTWLRRTLHGLLQPASRRRSTYDEFMLRFHDWLKSNRDFQRTTPKRIWHFEPGAVWLVMSDGASHAVLSGRFALEQSYFIAPESLVLPAESPQAIFDATCASDARSGPAPA